MKRILTDKRFINLIGLIAIALLVWFGADYISFGKDPQPLSSLTRILIIVAVVVVWWIASLYKQLRSTKKNKQLVEDLQVAKTDEIVSSKSIAENDELKKRFEKAMTTLGSRQSNRSRGNRAIYEIPWYIIIGPPGAGKTTALLNSGLDFPLNKSIGSIEGVGGTRNCDWWFGNDAVLLDTAGRYTTQDSDELVDKNAWNRFLDLLKRYRPRRPINGVIIAISIEELMLQTAAEAESQSKSIRARIDELHKKLGLGFPIYLVFTKCDLIAGFDEFFGNLIKSEREQLWGITFPFDDESKTEHSTEFFSKGFDDLLARLNGRLLDTINTESYNIQRRAAQLGFPQQFGFFKESVSNFIEKTFQRSIYGEPHLLRGVYFTSATQQGMPIDRIMSKLSNSFGLKHQTSNVPSDQGKSFFINKLFTNVIFPEAELVGVDKKFERLLTWGRRACFVGAGIVAILSLVIWSTSFTKNSLYMGEVESKIAAYHDASNKFRFAKSYLDVLPQLEALHSATLVYNQESHPYLSTLGMYDVSVDEATKYAYQSQLQGKLLPLVQRDLEQKLRTARRTDPTLMETLRVYLMLNNMEKRNLEAISDWSVNNLENKNIEPIKYVDTLKGHVKQLFDQPFPQVNIDARLVDRARKTISKIPLSARLYKQIKATNKIESPENLFAGFANSASRAFFKSKLKKFYIIPELLTRKGYQQADFTENSSAMIKLKSQLWVIDPEDGSGDYIDDNGDLSNSIETQYQLDYVRFWKLYVKSLALRSFNSLQDANEKLNEFSDPVDSPLLLALSNIYDNTQLNKSSLLDTAVNSTREGRKLYLKKALQHPIEKYFVEVNSYLESEEQREAPFTAILASLRAAHQFINDIISAPDPRLAAHESAKSRFLTPSRDVISDLYVQSSQAPEPIQGWLKTIADEIWGLLLKESYAHLNDVWAERVLIQCEATIQSRYPFKANTDLDVALFDFNDYFKPDGIHDTFIKEQLGPFINIKGNWMPKVSHNLSLPISKSSIAGLKKGVRITKAFYGKGGVSPNIKFSLKPLKLDSSVRKFEMSYGDNVIGYSHGPKIDRSLSWPVSNNDYLHLIFEDINESKHYKKYSGEWALFRMLAQFPPKRTRQRNKLKVSININKRKAEYQLTTKNSRNPFEPGLLSRYRCLTELSYKGIETP